MAGTWVCSILVTFDLWICQIAGCKKENSLITTCVQSQAQMNQIGVLFLVVELPGA